jgi:hypothetical protein
MFFPSIGWRIQKKSVLSSVTGIIHIARNFPEKTTGLRNGKLSEKRKYSSEIIVETFRKEKQIRNDRVSGKRKHYSEM